MHTFSETLPTLFYLKTLLLYDALVKSQQKNFFKHPEKVASFRASGVEKGSMTTPLLFLYLFCD